MVPTRNDTLIFSQIGYWFLANMLLNGFWLIIYTQDNKLAFLLGLIVITALNYTCFTIMMMSCRVELNTMEIIVIRGAFSIYSGWVTAANVVNIFQTLKSWKNPTILDDDFKNVKEEADKAETSLSVKAMYIVVLFYTAFSIYELNPLFGLILIWVLKAIQDSPSNESVTDTASLLLKVYPVIWLGILGFSIY